jgi:hypothetical protein
MKKGLQFAPYVTVSLILFMVCCKKHAPASNETASGCISDATVTLTSVGPLVTPPDLNVIVNLFRQNSLSTANQQFFSIDSNYFQPPGYTTDVDQVDILSYRWYNNLPVFRWNDNITFYNGIFQPQASIVYHGDAPGPDADFNQSLASLQTIWLNNFMRVGTYGPLEADTIPVHPNASYRDSCLIAKRGYIDAGFFTPTSFTYTGRLVKAWTVTPLNGSYPMVIIADSTGVAWPSNVYIP